MAALQGLLETAASQPDLPAGTARCLARMTVHLQVISETVHPATDADAPQAPDHPAIGVVQDVESRAKVLDLLGAELAERLVRPRPGPDDGSSAGLGPGSGTPPAWRVNRPALTLQEQRVLDLIAVGCTNREIATSLHLAEKTVKNYVSNLLHKLGIQRRTQAAVYAAHLDLAARLTSVPGGAA